MDRQNRFLDCLFTPAQESNRQDLVFTALSTESVAVAVDSAVYDVDYIAVKGNASSILESTPVNTLLGSVSCRIKKKCYLGSARTSTFNSVFVFASCGDFSIGIPTIGIRGGP